MVGKRFGKLVIVSVHPYRRGRTVIARCDCGQKRQFKASRISSGRQTSCGCTKQLGNVKDDPLYSRWRSVLRRCRPGSKDSPRYAGRGIAVCKRWQDFRAFRDDMGPSYQPGLTIERINNRRGYSPKNCRWATAKEQARNRRNNVTVDTPWGRILLAEAAERSGINYYTLWSRQQKGLPLLVERLPLGPRRSRF